MCLTLLRISDDNEANIVIVDVIVGHRRAHAHRVFSMLLIYKYTIIGKRALVR